MTTPITIDNLLKKPSKKAKLYNHFSISIPNEMHQIDLLFLPTDNGHPYALTLVDCASRYKAARPMKTKLASEAIEKLMDIYETDKYLTTPSRLNMDGGGEFSSKDMKIFAKNNQIKLVYNKPSHHLAFVENFNKELAKELFKYQNQKELETGVENTEWVKNLQKSVKKMNNRVTRLIKMKPIDAIQLKSVPQPENKIEKTDTEKFHPIGTKVLRMLNWDEYQSIFDGSIKVERRRATDPYWDKTVFTISELTKRNKNSLVEHLLKDENGKQYPHSYTYYQLQQRS
jgi:hypothetical protein